MKNIDTIKNLSKEDLEKELLIAYEMINYYEAIKQEAVERMLNGESFNGYKIKRTTVKRKIIDEDLLLKKAHQFNINMKDLYEMKLLSFSVINDKFKNKVEFLDSLKDVISEEKISYYLVKDKGDVDEKEN